MASHDLHDERALVWVCRGRNCVDGLDDPVQGRVGADRHVRATEIVVDWTHHADNVQVTALDLLFLTDFSCSLQFILIHLPKFCCTEYYLLVLYPCLKALAVGWTIRGGRDRLRLENHRRQWRRGSRFLEWQGLRPPATYQCAGGNLDSVQILWLFHPGKKIW